jgi:hypothetical protein
MVFFAFFAALLVWFFFADHEKLRQISPMPLDEEADRE